MLNENHSAGASTDRRAVIGVISHRANLLVIRRSQVVRAPGKLCFPGGEIELGESVEQALVRELAEELNVRVEPQRHLWTSRSPLSGCTLFWWSAVLADPNPSVRINPEEVASYHWMTIDEMASQTELLESNQAFIRAYRQRQFDLTDLFGR